MSILDEIFSIRQGKDFEELALRVFHYQAENNLVYKSYIDKLNINSLEINRTEDVPFLPIRFFKNFEVVTGNDPIEKTFTSSGTTGSNTSRHMVSDLNFYYRSLYESFEYLYGDFKDYTFFALLPSYLERSGSSLIDMVEYWIGQSGQTNKGFYLYNHEELYHDLTGHEKSGRKAILIGVSFALLDFIEKYPMRLKNTIVMETGGMKGRKKEITRSELHRELSAGFGTDKIHSEYGMTELLSQAYSQGNSRFKTPPWMKILIRETDDPFTITGQGKTGGINVIDLANYNSCSFIATDDLGKCIDENSYEILGRFDHSDTRGCNLLVV